MAARKQSDTHEHIVRITRKYMGATSERFINRQIRNHLHKEPHEITVDDVSPLTGWIQIAISHLTDDQLIVREYIDQLERLARKSDKGSTN